MALKAWMAATLLAVATVAAAQQTGSLEDRKYGPWGVDLGARDLSVRPGDDFDYYAGGMWAKTAVIPPDSSFAGPYEDLRRLSEARLNAIIVDSPADAPIGALYRSYMDEHAVELRGSSPLLAALQPIRAAADRNALLLVLARPGFAKPPVELDIDTDPADATRMSVGLEQGGLTLPDRDYYLLDRFAPQRAAFRPYVERMLARTGDVHAASHADAVVAFETAIARVSYSRADAQDPTKSINPTTFAALAETAPGISWQRFAAAARLPSSADGRVIVGERDAIRAIATLWAETPLDTLKAWAAFRTANSAARFLPHAFSDDWNQLINTLRGVAVTPSRERLGISLVDRRLGDLIGQDYVRRFFDPARKVAMTELAGNVKAAMRRRLAANAWLSPASRATALAKLDRLTVMVGYPDLWRDYSGLRLRADDLFGNAQRLNEADWAWQLTLLRQPVDRRRWEMTPQTVNAYNSGQTLTIAFPAARLQPPFFGLSSDPAVNYGAIGSIIGHEISHSFDDRGRHIDVNGAFHDWWTAVDVAEFDHRIAVLGAQYNAMEPLPGVHINGVLTMGENIADVAGVAAALDAYHASLGGHLAPVIDGLTGDQRFFLAYAQARREKQTDADLRDQISTDDHAPSRFRVIGAVRNIDAWYDAFGVRPGDRYYLAPEQRARIW